MAQLFSSGTSPEYLKAMADAYAMYFPQQQTYNPQTQQTTTGTLTPEYQQALQQWYGAAGAAPTAVVPSPQQQSIVGGLFEDLYPQTRGSGGGSNRGESMGPAYAGPSTQSIAEGLASAGINYGNVLGGMLPGGWLTNLLGQKYIDYRISDAAANGGPTGTYTGYAAFGDRPNNTMTEAQTMAAIAGTGGGPLSGEAFGGGGGYSSPMGGDAGSSGAFGGGFGYGNTGDRDSMGNDTGRTGTSF